MRFIFSTALAVLLFQSFAFSQSTKDLISFKDSVLVNPVPGSDSAEVTLTLQTGDLRNVKWIQVRYGSEMGKGNFMAMDLVVVEDGSKRYLKHNELGYLYPIVNNTVTIKRYASLEALNNPGQLEIKVKGAEQKELFKLEKKTSK